MDPAEETVVEVLRRKGYATGQFGKWHLGDDPAQSPNSQGFDVALTFRGAAMGRRQYFNPTLLLNGASKHYEGYCMDIFTDAALDFIKQHRAGPFFVYLAANLIHTPLVVDEELAAPYADLGTNSARVYGMIKSLDANFGRLCATLKAAGLEENTLLIFASDNGPCAGSAPTNRFMAGLHGLKGTVYENGIRVPFFARWPAAFHTARKVDRLTAHIDLMPTILEACGVVPPAGVKLDGISFLPLLRDPRARWPERTLFFQWDSGQAPRRDQAWCAVTERYKLVQPTGMDSPAQQHIRDRYAELCALQDRGRRSIEGPARYELYDLAADPGETTDLAARNPRLVARFRKEYGAWFDTVCARWSRAEP
jgi:arylsulfatase/arylsulfatase A